MYFDDAAECVKYLRAEADFNRSWTDGRRGNVDAPVAYKEARLRAAADRDRWATAIEDIIKLAKARST